MRKQPKALELADALGSGDVYESHSHPVYGWEGEDPCLDAADELRRQHLVIFSLVEELKNIQAAIYTDNDGQLRLSMSFDESVIDAAIAKATGEQP